MKIKQIIKTRAVKVSLFNAVALFLLCYFIDNLPYSFVGDATLGQRLDQVRQFVFPGKDHTPSDLLLINIAYDRQLVDVSDQFGLPKGNTDITDRAKLLDLLTRLRSSSYRYIILDVSFSQGHSTPLDSALFHTIASMRHIVVAKRQDTPVASPLLLSKARYSDYSTHISESNFVKYEYIRCGEPSLPYQAYLDMGGSPIRSFAGFCTFNSHLANKSIVLRHPVRLTDQFRSETDREAGLQYYNLGTDILESGVDIPEMARGRIIVIGDFTENDLHDTYLGKMAGPVINLNAYYALVNDNLSIPYLQILFLLILYFTISMFIIRGVTLTGTFPVFRRIRNKTFIFLLSFIGLSFVMAIIALVWYAVFRLDINILIPSLYFTLFGLILKYRKAITES